MTYVDGFLLAVSEDKKDEYVAFAKKTAEIYMRHGALSIVENWGNDIPEGKLTSMEKAVLCKPEEAVVFSWVTWPSKQVRDNAHDKIVEDMHTELADDPVPIDGSRMIFGGFETFIERNAD